MTTAASEAERTTKSFLADPEKRVLNWICARTPSWVLPDHLTLLAVFAAVGLGVAYGLSNRGTGWLWVASALLVVHWYGDSMDGTLARFRRIQRPRYGFYVDHLADAFATACVGMGLGLSPFMLFSVGLAIVMAYLILSINVYLETITRQQFRFGYGFLGPTEARIILIILNTAVVFVGPIPLHLLGLGETIFDLAGTIAALMMAGMLLRRLRRNLRILGRLEPPNVVRSDPPSQ